MWMPERERDLSRLAGKNTEKEELRKVWSWLCIEHWCFEHCGGMAILAYYPDGRKMVLSRAGTIFDKLHSAFVAEILALEWCLCQIAWGRDTICFK